MKIKIIKDEQIKQKPYLWNFLIPGISFRQTNRHQSLGIYFLLSAGIIFVLAIILKRDLWSLGLYGLTGLVTNFVYMICIMIEKSNSDIKKKQVTAVENEEEKQNENKKVDHSDRNALIVLILPAVPWLFSIVYTNTPEGTDLWKEKREAKAYLISHYGDHFTIEDAKFVRPMLGFDIISVVTFHANENPKKHYKVNRAIGEDFADTYMSDALEMDFGKDLDPLIKEAFGEDAIYFLWCAPSDALRAYYNPAHKGIFSEYISQFAKDYETDETGRHLDTEISVIRFLDFKTTDLNAESDRVVKLGKAIESKIPATCHPGLKLRYISPIHKKEIIKIINSDGFDYGNHMFSDQIFNLSDFDNNTVIMYPDEHPNKETLIKETYPTIH